MKKGYRIILGIFVVVALVVMYGISQFNSLKRAEQGVESHWSEVENNMQRRSDLIPNLINSVKGSMGQEQKVFGDITKARENYGSANTTAEKMEASQVLDRTVGTLISVINENYPELKSNDNVADLMNQLEGSENRIAVARKRYNDEVETYNKMVVTFPKNIFANMMGLGKKDFFKADETAKTVPSVNFDDVTN